MMDDSFEVSALERSIHKDQYVFPYQCNECTYKLQTEFKGHKHAKHPVPVAAMPSQTHETVKLMCEHCGIEFKSKYGLRCHIKSRHEGTFKYTCDSCGRGSRASGTFGGI